MDTYESRSPGGIPGVGDNLTFLKADNGNFSPDRAEFQAAEFQPQAAPAPPKPDYYIPGFRFIPDPLKSKPLWICWKAVLVRSKKGWKWTKVPVSARTGAKVSVTDPANFASFEIAWSYFFNYRGNLDGIGLVMSDDDDLIGVDIDNCVVAGVISPEAKEIIERFDSYAEYSPSGNGIRVFVRGCIPDGTSGRRHAGCEMYSDKHYLTITGAIIGDSPFPIIGNQNAINWFFEKYIDVKSASNTPARPVNSASYAGSLDDDSVIEKARNAKNSAKFCRLFFDGDTSDYPSGSEADFALAEIFAFYTGGNQEQIHRLLNQSALKREKWKDNKTYLERTIKEAIKRCGDFYRPRNARFNGGNGAVYARYDSAPENPAAENVFSFPSGKPTQETDPETAAEINRLATLNSVAYSQERREAAKKLGISQLSVLDSAVIAQRRNVIDGNLARDVAADGLSDTEYGIARAFVALYGKTFRFCHSLNQWFIWDSVQWKPDASENIIERIAQFCRGNNVECKAALEKASTIKGVAYLIARMSPVSVTADVWDRDKYLLGTADGPVDLRTGELRLADPENYITKMAGCVPADTEDCKLWRIFIEQVTKDDKPFQRFIQQFFGYCLTGDVSDQIILFVYGPGKNGKSVLLEILKALLHDYAKTARIEIFIESHYAPSDYAVATWPGVRLVTSSEPPEGKNWREDFIKALSGGDTLEARHPYGRPFNFVPELKLLFVGNHRPTLRNVGTGIKRRLRIIPFMHTPKTPDKNLLSKLLKELPGIMRWAIKGCLDWQENGFLIPNVVEKETEAYFDEQDIFGQWIAEDFVKVKTERIQDGVPFSVVFTSWKAFCEPRNMRAGSEKKLSGRLYDAGFGRDKYGSIRYVSDLRLKTAEDRAKEHASAGLPQDYEKNVQV